MVSMACRMVGEMQWMRSPITINFAIVVLLPYVADRIYVQVLFRFVFDRRQSLLQHIVALVKAMDGLVDAVGSGLLALIAELMCQIMQLIGMVPVVLQHVPKQRQGLLHRILALGMLMVMVMLMGMGMIVHTRSSVSLRRVSTPEFDKDTLIPDYIIAYFFPGNHI
jgi:hypothetical protein